MSQMNLDYVPMEGMTNEQVGQDYFLTTTFLSLRKAMADAKAAKKIVDESKKIINDELGDTIGEVQPGTSGVIYENNNLVAVAKVASPAARLDSTKFESELRRRGIDKDVIEAAKEAATVYNKPAVSIEVTPKQKGAA